MALLDYTLSKLLLGERLKELQLEQQRTQAQRDAQLLGSGAQAVQQLVSALPQQLSMTSSALGATWVASKADDVIARLLKFQPARPDYVSLPGEAPAAKATDVSKLVGDAKPVVDDMSKFVAHGADWSNSGKLSGDPDAPVNKPAPAPVELPKAAPLPVDLPAPSPATPHAARPKTSAPTSGPPRTQWARTPEEEADAYLASRGMHAGDSSWLGKLAGVPDSYDFHRARLVDQIKGQRRAQEAQELQQYLAAQKSDLENRVGESTIAKNFAEADKAKGADGGRQAQLAHLAAGAMSAVATQLKDALNSDDPNEVIAAQQQLRDAATKGLVEAGVNVTDPKEQVAIKAAQQQGLEDVMKEKKKRDLDDKYIEGLRSANTNLDRLDRLQHLREQAKFAPTTMQIVRNQLDGVGIPVNVGGVLTFDVGKINDKLLELQKHGDLTPAQANYLAEAYSLKNEMAKIANGGFNLTDGDVKRVDTGLFDPYSTPEEYRARMTSLKYTMTRALKQKVEDLNPTFKVPTGLYKEISRREVPSDYAPQAGDDVAFGARADAADPAKVVGDQIGKATAALPALVTGGGGAGPPPPENLNATPAAAKAINAQILVARLGMQRFEQIQRSAVEAGVDLGPLFAALARNPAKGDDLYVEAAKQIEALKKRR